MAIIRKQYITVDELNEILLTTYLDDPDTNQEIIEASELISYHTLTRSDTLFESTNVEQETLDLLKIATAYQVLYKFDNEGLDDSYEDASDSFSLGRFSQNKSGETGKGATKEWKKVSPKTNRYLSQANLMYSGGDTYSTGRGAFIID